MPNLQGLEKKYAMVCFINFTSASLRLAHLVSLFQLFPSAFLPAFQAGCKPHGHNSTVLKLSKWRYQHRGRALLTYCLEMVLS